jgi:hypothetical protein
MKRTLLTILAIFYLGVSSGATVHFHYCMGELVSWGLAKQAGKVCDFCGMSKTTAKKKSWLKRNPVARMLNKRPRLKNLKRPISSFINLKLQLRRSSSLNYIPVTRHLSL